MVQATAFRTGGQQVTSLRLSATTIWSVASEAFSLGTITAINAMEADSGYVEVPIHEVVSPEFSVDGIIRGGIPPYIDTVDNDGDSRIVIAGDKLRVYISQGGISETAVQVTSTDSEENEFTADVTIHVESYLTVAASERTVDIGIVGDTGEVTFVSGNQPSQNIVVANLVANGMKVISWPGVSGGSGVGDLATVDYDLATIAYMKNAGPVVWTHEWRDLAGNVLASGNPTTNLSRSPTEAGGEVVAFIATVTGYPPLEQVNPLYGATVASITATGTGVTYDYLPDVDPPLGVTAPYATYTAPE